MKIQWKLTQVTDNCSGIQRLLLKPSVRSVCSDNRESTFCCEVGEATMDTGHEHNRAVAATGRYFLPVIIVQIRYPYTYAWLYRYPPPTETDEGS